jgi:hypothetical protein
MIAAFGVDSQDTPVMAQTHTKKAASNILTLPEWSVVDHNQELFRRALAASSRNIHESSLAFYL